MSGDRRRAARYTGLRPRSPYPVRWIRAPALRIKPFKLVTLAVLLVVFLFLFTRPSDYRNLVSNISGTLENQWCAWSQLVGHECDRWRHGSRFIDGAREFGERLRSRLPPVAPVEDAGSRQD